MKTTIEQAGIIFDRLERIAESDAINCGYSNPHEKLAYKFGWIKGQLISMLVHGNDDIIKRFK